MAHSNEMTLSVLEMLAKVHSDCEGLGAKIKVVENTIFISPPENYSNGHTFADTFYDYDEYKSAGWVLDGNSDHTEFRLDLIEPLEPVCSWCGQNYSDLRLVVLGNSDDEELCCKNCWLAHQLEDEGYSCTGDDFSDDED